MKKLIGYVRVSSEVSKNKGNSIINQINKVNEFCKYNEFELIDDLKNPDAFNINNKTEKKMDVLKTDDFSVLPAPIKSVCMVWAGQDIKKSEVHIEPKNT